MKRIISIFTFIVVVLINVIAGPNPIVKRLSYEEITQSRTPSAVAYNYIMAILAEDYQKMLSYMSDDGKVSLGYLMCEADKEAGIQSYHALYSFEGSKYNILAWLSCIGNGYEVVPLYVQDMDDYYDGKESLGVYIHCVPTNEIGVQGFQDITRCNEINPKVMLTKENGKWMVLGLK